MGNTKGEGLFYNVASASFTIKKYSQLLIHILKSALNLFSFFMICHDIFRVWPNTAGVILELKVGRLPLCHLVR